MKHFIKQEGAPVNHIIEIIENTVNDLLINSLSSRNMLNREMSYPNCEPRAYLIVEKEYRPYIMYGWKCNTLEQILEAAEIFIEQLLKTNSYIILRSKFSVRDISLEGEKVSYSIVIRLLSVNKNEEIKNESDS